MPSSSSAEQGRGGGRKTKDIWTLIRTRFCFKVNASSSFSTEQKQCETLNDSNNNSSSSASASLVGSNVDILTLILTRLPSKSLLIVKSVSKQWLSMITDPHFVRQHFIQNPRFSIPGLFWGDDESVNYPEKPTYYYISLVGYADYYIPFDTLTFTEDRFGIKIVQSCGALFLCKSCSLSAFDFTYYIYNPFTNKYKMLPRSEFGASRKFISSVSLAFDPLRSSYYKVITVWKDDKSSCYEYIIEIYDSETSSWRMSGFYSCTAQAESIPLTSGVFYNGSLYWCHGGGGYLVSFDIGRELRVWPQEFSGEKNFQIVEYGGHFYLFQTDRPFSNRFSIFKMDANSSWNFKGQVDVSLNRYGTYTHFSADSILFIIERGEESESTKVVLLSTDGVVFSYELKDWSFEKISLMCDLSARPKFRYGVKFHPEQFQKLLVQ